MELQRETCDLTKGYLAPDKLIIGQRTSLIEKTVDSEGNVIETTYPSLNIEEDISVYIPYTQKELYEQEIEQIKYWFFTDYTERFEKCNRKIALGLNLRDGTNPSVALSNLYAEAERKSNRIHELETLLKSM